MPSAAAPAPAWSDAEVDQLLADLHRRGFGTLTRDTVSTQLRMSPRASSFWDELRGSAGQAARAIPRAAVAVRRFAWKRLAVASVAAAVVGIALFSWYRPRAKVKLSPQAIKAVHSEVDLIDVAAFAAGCSPGDTDAHLQRFASGNPEAHDVACLAATGSGTTALAVLEGTPLTDADPVRARRLRRNAASVLVGLGPAAVATLCPRLGDPSGEVRVLASLSLGFADSPEALACVRQALSTGSPDARASATYAMRRQIARGAIDVGEGWRIATGLLGEADPGSRIAGLGLLSLFTPAVAAPAARPLADDPDPAVAGAAREALTAIDAVRKIELLSDPS
jgi:hypothetical protein